MWLGTAPRHGGRGGERGRGFRDGERHEVEDRHGVEGNIHGDLREVLLQLVTGDEEFDDGFARAFHGALHAHGAGSVGIRIERGAQGREAEDRILRPGRADFQ